MSQPLLKCEHVDFGYENYDVVKDVSLEICQGDYLCIVGENGSGKSTLMKGLLGLLKPTGGSLMVSDDLKRSGIGYLPQQTPAQKDFPATVQEVVISGCLGKRGNRPFYSKKERETAAVNMERLGITDLRKSCYRDLSGGQKQRTLIARALCATDRLLILDEPITGLDPSTTQDFYRVIRHLNREEQVAVLMVSHDIQNIVAQANKILHLKQSVLFYGLWKTINRRNAGDESWEVENDGAFKRNAFVSVHRPGADRRPSDLSVRLPSGGEPGAETVFHDRGRLVPCILWSPVRGRGLWVGSPGGIHPCGGRRRGAAPSDHRQWQDQERCGHCHDLCPAPWLWGSSSHP